MTDIDKVISERLRGVAVAYDRQGADAVMVTYYRDGVEIGSHIQSELPGYDWWAIDGENFGPAFEAQMPVLRYPKERARGSANGVAGCREGDGGGGEEMRWHKWDWLVLGVCLSGAAWALWKLAEGFWL